MRSENVEGQLSQNREVLRSMVLAVSGAILVEDNVENPMELVLDRPVGADHIEKPCGREPARQQEVSDQRFFLAVEAADGIDARHRPEPRGRVGFGEARVRDYNRPSMVQA